MSRVEESLRNELESVRRQNVKLKDYIINYLGESGNEEILVDCSHCTFDKWLRRYLLRAYRAAKSKKD